MCLVFVKSQETTLQTILGTKGPQFAFRLTRSIASSYPQSKDAFSLHLGQNLNSKY